MKPYNKKAKCPKCGEKNISDIWYEKDESYWYKTGGGLTNTEHIKRFCENCKFEWAEKPLNK